MQIQVDENPNCEPSEQYVFQEIESPKPIQGIKVTEGQKESSCEIVGVNQDGVFSQAHVVKITDSGAGFAYLIYGGNWGIRLKPQEHAKEAWDISNKHQWGEPFKIYGEVADLIF